MSPYDPMALSSIWFLAWRNNIRSAKANPECSTGFQHGAAIANAEYVMAQAVEFAKTK